MDMTKNGGNSCSHEESLPSNTLHPVAESRYRLSKIQAGRYCLPRIQAATAVMSRFALNESPQVSLNINWNASIVFAVFLLVFSATNHLAEAGGYWRFYISVDGKPAFTGGVGVFGDFSPLDHLESSVKGGVQLGTDSFLDENTSGDITLTGDVVFRDQQHPPLHMKRLRLIYNQHESDRLDSTFVAGGYYDWRLHPDDASFIVSHYRHEAGVARVMRIGRVIAAIVVVCVVFLGVLLLTRRRTRPS